MTTHPRIYSGGQWTLRGEEPLPPYSPPTPPASRVTPWLPWDMPSRAQLAAAPKKAFAHYMTPFPVSVDNADPATDYWMRYWWPPGAVEQTTDHRPYGGLVRNRPLTRPPRSGSDWEDRDKAWEIRQAASAFLDGFLVDLFQVSPKLEWTRAMQMWRGALIAADPYFKLIPMPDGQTSGTADPTILANNIATIASHPATYRRPNGRFLLSSWAPELAPAKAGAGGSAAVAFWQTVIARLVALGVPTDFWPCYVRDWTAAAQGDAFDPIVIGHGNWGPRNPGEASLTNGQNAGAPDRCHTRYPGKLWLGPVALEDERPGQKVYRESWGWKNLETMWATAILFGADWVQLPTWNDYGEGSEWAPSFKRGWAPLDVNTWWLHEFKLGYTPTILTDAAYLIHRTQPTSGVTYDGYSVAQPDFQIIAAGTYTPPKDVAQAMVFLTSPADVTITVGGVPSAPITCPAGRTIVEAPLRPGQVVTEVTRGGTTVASVTTGRTVRAFTGKIPGVQDLGYVAAGSLDHISRPGVAA